VPIGTVEQTCPWPRGSAARLVDRPFGVGPLREAVALRRPRRRSGLRQVSGTLKEGLGQVTHHERPVAQEKADRLHGKAEQRG
jgi:hypothetical protein